MATKKIKLSREYFIKYSEPSNIVWEFQDVKNLCKLMNKDLSVRSEFISEYNAFIKKYKIRKDIGSIFVKPEQSGFFYKNGCASISGPIRTVIGGIFSQSEESKIL